MAKLKSNFCILEYDKAGNIKNRIVLPGNVELTKEQEKHLEKIDKKKLEKKLVKEPKAGKSSS